MDFFIPDERGNQPRDQVIDTQYDEDYYILTKLVVDRMAEDLKRKGHTCMESEDAGDYICNYTYFCSLEYSRDKVKNP